MKLGRYVVALLLFSSAAFFATRYVTAASPSGADKIAGTYVLDFDYTSHGYTMVGLQLRHDRTGVVAVAGERVAWSTSKRMITIVVTKTSMGGSAIYRGVVTSAGFNTSAHPGTVSSSDGRTGMWYATKTS
jgi:hypothetical protein